MIGLGLSLPSRAVLSGGAFSPARLFARAEPGVWYDPSDVANLSWRRNLLTYSEQFDNAAWSKTRAVVNANATTAPNETNTAEKLIEDTTASNTHVLRQSPTLIAGTAYTYSIYAKAAGRDFCRILVGDTGGNNAVYVDVNLNNGSIASGTNGIGWTLVAASATAVGGGWYRVVVSGTSATDTNGVVLVYIASGLGTIVYTGDGTSGIYIWGAQLEVGSTATDYQRITDVHTEVRERFPNATLYQDTAGTQPVTTAAQSVALMLDKSRGLTLGAELVAPINFTSGWSASGSAVTFDSAATFTAAGIANVFRSLFTVGALYRVDIRATFTGGVVLYNSNTALNPIGSALVSGQTQTFYFNAAAAQLNFRTTSAGTVTVDNISVRELPGNHAAQAITASRPIYAVEPTTGRRNLLTYTEQFDNAAWTKIGATVSANVDTAPDGTQSADRLQANSGTVSPLISQNITVGACSASIYAKAGTSAFIQLSFNGDGTSYVNFDLSLGSVGTSTGTASGTITALGSGWYRCSVANSATNITGFVWSIVASSSALRRASFSATGSENFLIWGAQVETGSTATAYQRVVSKYDVTEAGVPSRSYLSFDGIDDFMVTPTITPGIDKAQVFAGVRKLSDALVGTAVELSPNAQTNPGAFELRLPRSNGVSNGRFLSGGTLQGEAVASPLVAPITNILTGLGDIGGDVVRLRVNGVQVSEALTDQGTGNFLAYPLYIGRRGGSSLLFNGNIYGMIVRFGANLSGGQVIATENWLTARTIPASRWINAPEPVPAVGEAHQGGFYFGQIWDEITTSTNSVAIATGRQLFSVSNTAPLFYAGQTVKVVSRADAGNRIMEGKVVQSYDNVLVVDVTSTTGSGTYTDWSVLAKYRLIVAPKSSGENSGVAYKNASTAAPVAAQTLTNGPAATAAMVAADSSTVYPLAHWADGLSIGGYTDWYVPARDELELIWRNLKPVTNNNSTGDRPKSSIVYANGGNQNDVSGDDHGVNRHSEPTGAAYTTSDPGQTSVTAFRSGNSEALEFTSTFYWSSSEFSSSNGWGQFYSPSVPGNQGNTNKTNSFKARAIRRSLV